MSYVVKKMTRPQIEIMSPVGSYESLMAAIQAGAGSVYFGIGDLNMRSHSAVNFTENDLPEIVSLCRENHVKSYLTLNTVVFDHELVEMRRLVDLAKSSSVDAIIASDMAVLEYAKKAGVELHASTQLNISNIEALRFFSQWCDVVVLARELSLEQQGEICRQVKEQNICGPSENPVRIEVFVHGALCMATSGKCYLSLHHHNKSANRGKCYQNCRRSYTVTEKETGYQLDIENDYIMSPKDLCTIGFLDKILDAGVSVLKIEGRARAPEYVKVTTQCYHEAVESWQNGTFSREGVEAWERRLMSVFNRGFWGGYYMGKNEGEWSENYGSAATRHKEYLGYVTNYFSNLGVAEVLVETGSIAPGDEILIIGPTTGVAETTPERIDGNNGSVGICEKGHKCSFAVPGKVRRNDKVFKWVERKLS